jgi:serine/threonine-protein kinase PknG
MKKAACKQPGCTGGIEDGYCDVCGHAAAKYVAAVSAAASSRESRPTSPVTSSAITTGTGSTPMSRSATGSRRTSHTSSRTTRKQLGAGLITLPDLPSLEPEKAVLLDPSVPERKRFCGKCEAPLKREAGFCGKCGTRYSFVPSLRAGDVVANQYEVRGPIAFGGLGWIYLGFDRLLSRYVVLKGLLNTQDASAAAAAMAERQFLAAVKHPNIVGIYNFVQFGSEGFIVMEYVGGKTLKQIRQERGPLPVAEAIAYIHRILPAFAYLHRLGMVYCDFKPDNVMLERDDVKLIDLGGVRRIDDTAGDIYGTVGYSAPEAGAGPTPASDLFTIGRTLAVLLTDIHGFSKEHRYTLPGPQEDPRFAGQESLYRLLLKSTSEAADDRFEDADEMAEQALGVLREVVAVETAQPRSGPSLFFGADQLALNAGDEMQPVLADPRHLPLPSLDTSDPAAQAVSSAIAQTDLEHRVNALRLVVKQHRKSREARLRLAATLAEAGVYKESETLLHKLGEEDAWDWRVLWFQGCTLLTQNKASEARKLFDQVYFDLPGEITPKLALGLAAELSGDLSVAIKMYDLVARTDPGYASAVFGLARCLERSGDRTAAVAALDRIPSSSALWLRSRVQAALTLVRADQSAPRLEDLTSASLLTQDLTLSGLSKVTILSQILTAAVDQVYARKIAATPTAMVCGTPVEESKLRFALEKTLRERARYVAPEERILLVDRANQVRPRTLI